MDVLPSPPQPLPLPPPVLEEEGEREKSLNRGEEPATVMADHDNVAVGTELKVDFLAGEISFREEEVSGTGKVISSYY